MTHVWDFLEEFESALEEQLRSDEKRWGNTWLLRTRDGQEDRTIARLNDYFNQWKESKTPLPWLKIAGEALICWIRETHPELWKK